MSWPLVESFMWHHLESSCRIVKLDASKIISRNFRSLRDDSTTRNILNKLPLKAYGRSKNLRDLLVRSSLPRNLSPQTLGTLPCNRTVCRTFPRVNSSSTITTLKGHVSITIHFSCITENMVIVSRAANVHRQCTLGRPDAGLRSTLESMAEISSTEEWPSCTFLPQPNKSYTWGHEGCCIEGRPSQPGMP